MSGAGHIGRYEIQEVCWIEPVGRTVRARLPDLNREVYLRELCPPPALLAADQERLVRAFEAESRLLSRLADPRLPRPCDLGATERGTYFLAYDLPEASGFAPLFGPPAGCSPEALISIAVHLLEACALLQEAGLPIRSLQPDCCFVSPSGEVRMLVLSQSHLVLAAQLPRVLLAPCPYAAPEVAASGQIVPATFVFSVGAWLYGVLGGPGTPSAAAIVAAGKRPEPLWTRNTTLGSAIDDLVQTALEADPARRFRTPRAFAAALPGQVGVSGSAPASGVRRDLARQEAVPPKEETPLVLRFAAWAVGLGVAGSLLGWGLGRLFPPP